MLLLGLTGSIATGKSTVSNILRAPPYNLPIIDADVLARKVVEPGTSGYDAIVAHFGPSTPDLLVDKSECGGSEQGADGKGRPLNRPALGRRIFGNSPEAVAGRKKLNGIVHPAVRKEMLKEILSAYIRGSWAVVLDIPLLFESGFELLCGTIMVVAVKDPDTQMQRLRTRDPHLTEEDARSRVASQADVREKAARAEARGEGWGVTVWNDGGRDELKQEIDRVMNVVMQKSPRWWAWLLLLMPPLATVAGISAYVRSYIAMRRWAKEKGQEKARL